MPEHTCTLHPAGERSCYISHSCRCRACTDAATRWQRHFNYAKSQGRRFTVPVGPVAAHIARLSASGMTLREIARVADVPAGTIRNLSSGRTKRVQIATASSLQAVPPRSAGGHANVDAIGTARRLQSLAWMGWDAVTLAPLLGWSPSFVRTLRAAAQPAVHAATRDRVHAVWDHLALVENVGPGASRARLLAERNRWEKALAWDDETIDDPNAKPWRPQGRQRLIDAIADAAAQGLTLEEASEALGRKPDALYQSCRRAGELELWERFTRGRAA